MKNIARNLFSDDYIISSMYFSGDTTMNKKLTNHQQNQLIYLARKGNTSARNKLVLANQGLIYFFAKPYTNRGVSLEDLIMEGNLGLIKAIDRFDPGVGVKFSSYAKWWIKDSLNRARRNFGHQVQLPRGQTRIDSSDSMESTERHQQYRNLQEKNNCYSMAKTDNDTENTPELSFQSCETLYLKSEEPSPYQLIQKLQSNHLVRDLFSQLTSKERLILSNEFEIDTKSKLTQVQISQYLRIKPATHLQIKRRLLHRLRLILAVKGINSYNDLADLV